MVKNLGCSRRRLRAIAWLIGLGTPIYCLFATSSTPVQAVRHEWYLIGVYLISHLIVVGGQTIPSN